MCVLSPSWSYEQKYDREKKEKLSKFNSVPPNNFLFCQDRSQRQLSQQRWPLESDSRKLHGREVVLSWEMSFKRYQIPWQMVVTFVVSELLAIERHHSERCWLFKKCMERCGLSNELFHSKRSERILCLLTWEAGSEGIFRKPSLRGLFST